MIDVDHLSTQPINKDDANKRREDTGGTPFGLRISSNGPGGDGVNVVIGWEDDSEEKLCEFYVPDDSWKTFVSAVKAVDAMWDQHEST